MRGARPSHKISWWKDGRQLSHTETSVEGARGGAGAGAGRHRDQLHHHLARGGGRGRGGGVQGGHARPRPRQRQGAQVAAPRALWVDCLNVSIFIRKVLMALP